MAWYSRFGLDNNPFSTDPFSSEYTVVNYTHLLDELFYHVQAGHIFVLVGESGVGKTTMLLQIVKKYGGKGRILYIDGNVYKKEVDIEELLKERGCSFFDRVRGKKPQSIILLLDNAENLSSVNMQKLKYYFDHNHVQSVVFSTTDVQRLNLSGSIKDRVGDNICQVPPMISYDALRVVRDRFPDSYFLSDDIILKIFEQSDSNIKITLQNCEKVCAYVAKEGKGEVLQKYVRKVLGKSKKKEQPENASRPAEEKSIPTAQE